MITRNGGWPFTHPPLGVPFMVNRASPQAAGLAAWWPTVGPGVGSSVLLDKAGAARNGTVTNATWTPHSVVGSALSFNGTTAYVPITGGPNLSGDMTVSAWVNPAIVSAGAKTIAGDGNIPGSLQQWSLEMNRTAAKLTVLWGNALILTGTRAHSANTWYHVCMTRAGSAGSWTATLYSDGVQDAQTTTATNPSAQQGMSIGRLGLLPTILYWSGKIADVRLWNRALTPPEVFALYAPQSRWELYAPAPRQRSKAAAVTMIWPGIGPGAVGGHGLGRAA